MTVSLVGRIAMGTSKSVSPLFVTHATCQEGVRKWMKGWDGDFGGGKSEGRMCGGEVVR